MGFLLKGSKGAKTQPLRTGSQGGGRAGRSQLGTMKIR